MKQKGDILPRTPHLHLYICAMSVRQEKFASLLQKDISDIILQQKDALFEGNFITVSNVEVSPDLGYAKIFLSILDKSRRNYLMELMEFYTPQIRKALGSKLRNQVRKIPEIKFLLDESLDHVEHMDRLFKNLNIPPESKEEGQEEQ